MNIFNSLGSNYNFEYIKRNLLSANDDEYSLKLSKLLEDKYGGKSVLTYKGREALRLALRIINKQKDYVVGICGFTCFAVYEAIVKEGYEVEYLDIEVDSLNFSLEVLKSSFKKNPKLKIIFVQNTLGYPCDIDSISKFCIENDIILVEDLAHSIGAKYANGKEAGTVGDFVMLSFSQDKVIDRVSGGALIVRNTKYFAELSSLSRLRMMGPTQKVKDKLYPLWSMLIRNNYNLGIGKLLHFILKKINSLSSPMVYEDMNNIHFLPNGYAQEIYFQFKSLEEYLHHRRKIAEVYIRLLNKKMLNRPVASTVTISSNLRFPIFLEERRGLINYLKKNNIYISDIWYDVPIAPRKYFYKTNYKTGSCPNTEVISKKILNLPTHRNVSEKDAELISQKINIWLKLQ